MVAYDNIVYSKRIPVFQWYRMTTNTENIKINRILSQIQNAIINNYIVHQNDITWVFSKLSDINHKVVPSNYLQSEHAEYIGHTVLHFSAHEMKLEAFDIFLNHGVDFTIKNNNGLTALHLLLQKQADSTSKVYKLDNPFVDSVLSAHLEYRNFENPSNDDGHSHFHIACTANNIEAVKGFLQSGVFIDHAVKTDSPTFPGFTSLHFAAKYCAFEVTELLLTHGANVHIKDAKGMTALHVALERKLEIIDDIGTDETLRHTNDKILQLFLNKQSNSDVVMIDEWGLSNLHVSCTLKDSKIVEYILPKAVDINHAVSMDSPFWTGYTALHFAAMCNVDTVKLLMKNGADINIKDAKGVTPFDMCIERYENKDMYKIISLHPIWRNIMLSDGKTILSDLVFAMRNSNHFNIFLRKLSMNISICDSPLWSGCSLMHLAVLLAKTKTKVSEASEQMGRDILITLYEKNPSMLFSQDVHGRTPLHLAFISNKKSILNLLMAFYRGYFKLIDCVDEDGLSCMHIAAAQNDTLTLGRLLSKGTNVNIVYRGKSQFSPMVYQGSTALHFAVINGSTEAADMLVKRGADVYAKDANGMTPMHAIFLNENLNTESKMIDMLVSSPNLKDSIVSDIGLSHLHIASMSWRNGPKILAKLLDNGADINGRITNCQQHVIIESHESSLLKRYSGHSPLAIAFDRDNSGNVRLLLKRGADVFFEYKKEVALLYHVFEHNGLFVDEFLKAVKSSEALIARVKAETGITSLHLACFNLDIELIKKSLSDGANVNAQTLTDSPIFKRYTPLHIVLHFVYQYSQVDVIEVIELLLKTGADVTLQNAKLETTVHMAYNTYYEEQDDENCFRVNILLEAQRDFSINPTNIDGISHFHMACFVCNADIVEKFLNNAEININQPIDYFHTDVAGYTPLQLAAGCNGNICKVLSQLDTIDLLLNHRADVNAEDFWGDTPFHECARNMSLDVFERLARSGADVNIRNISGNTLLKCYLSSNNLSVEGIKTLARCGCCLNIYNALTHEGMLGEIVAKLFCTVLYTDVPKLLHILTVNFKQVLQMDNLGRTIIHNIVSIEPPAITGNQYAELIEQLSRGGCDIDDQDSLGRTALHMAVKFYNFKAISGLLLAGADINITDTNGKTALACDFDPCTKCNGNKDEKKCKHFETLKTSATYVKKLQLCGLDVDKQNEDFAAKAFEKLQRETVLTDEFFKELETVKSTKIESHALTLYDFLSEYGAVVDYPRMSEVKRYDVNKFFSQGKVQKCRGELPELAGILQLQYRKVRVRSELVELAKNALNAYAGFRLPEICSNFILILLSNSELKKLISSGDQSLSSIGNKK